MNLARCFLLITALSFDPGLQESASHVQQGEEDNDIFLATIPFAKEYDWLPLFGQYQEILRDQKILRELHSEMDQGRDAIGSTLCLSHTLKKTIDTAINDCMSHIAQGFGLEYKDCASVEHYRLLHDTTQSVRKITNPNQTQEAHNNNPMDAQSSNFVLSLPELQICTNQCTLVTIPYYSEIHLANFLPRTIHAIRNNATHCQSFNDKYNPEFQLLSFPEHPRRGTLREMISRPDFSLGEDLRNPNVNFYVIPAYLDEIFPTQQCLLAFALPQDYEGRKCLLPVSYTHLTLPTKRIV